MGAKRTDTDTGRRSCTKQIQGTVCDRVRTCRRHAAEQFARVCQKRNGRLLEHGISHCLYIHIVSSTDD
jgi:hypothetical protein